MKPMVLCILKDAILEQNPNANTTGLHPFNIEAIEDQNFSFINRKVVDSVDNEAFKQVGQMFPQVLPYIVARIGDKILSYSRNGAETRLHAFKSIGIGGHIDLSDYSHEMAFSNVIYYAACREVQEELGIQILEKDILTSNDMCIVDTANDVSTVHLGLYMQVKVEEYKASEELNDIQLLSVDELKANIDQYEPWSRLIITSL